MPPTAPPPAPKVDAELTAILQETDRVRKEIAGLNELLEGRLPQLASIRSLFTADLTDDKVVRERIAALEAQLRAQEKTAKEPEATTDAASQESPKQILERLRLERDRLRLAFLRKPKSFRDKLSEEDHERRVLNLQKQLDQMEIEVAALRELSSGKLPESYDIRKLFEVSLLDEAAVALRVELLKSQSQSQIATQSHSNDHTAPGGNPKSDETQPEPSPSPASTPPPSDDAGNEPTPTPVPTPTPPPSPPTEPELEARLAQLQLVRDQLRLQILELPAEKRKELVEAEEKRQRILIEQAEAARARAEAQTARQEAELARQSALEEALLAKSLAEKKIAEERARVEQMRGTLATLRVQLAGERKRHADQMAGALEKLDKYRQQVADVRTDTQTADATYDQIVASLTLGRSQLEQALNALGKDPKIPTYVPQIDLTDPMFDPVAEERAKLTATTTEVEAEIAAMIAEERDAQWTRVTELAGDVAPLNGLRLELLPLLSKDKRKDVLGLTGAGFAQFWREVRQIDLMTRFYVRSTARKFKVAISDPQRLIDLKSSSWIVVQLLGLVVVILVLGRRFDEVFHQLRGHVLSSKRDKNVQLLLERWLRFLQGVLPSISLLIFFYLAFHVLKAEESRELRFVKVFFLAYAWYRIVVAVAHQFIVGAAQARRVVLTPELNERIRTSVRLTARYIFPVVVFLIVSERILGRGYLYGLVVKFAWLGAFPIAGILIHRWRPSITRSYLEGFPDGRLAEPMRRVKDKPSGIFVVTAAVFPVIYRGARLAFNDSLSRFKYTRKAFAYLFRKQLEQHADSAGQSEDFSEQLPEELKAAFNQGPAPAELRIDHFPMLPKVAETIRSWHEGGSTGAVVVVGESGVGKSTWLAELARQVEIPETVMVAAPEDISSESDVCRMLASILNLDAENPEELIEKINQGPRRLLILDQCQNFVLRAVGGLDGFSAFAGIVSRTAPNILWICAFSRYIWEYVEKTYFGRSIFSRIVILDPWDESAIGDLIALRMQSAGFQASYEDLVVDKVDGTEFENEVVRTGERYRQLLCDYADGLPKVALHFWLRSLTYAGDHTVKVRLFKAPSADELEEFNDQSRFALAAIIIHQNLTLPEAEKVLNIPLHICELILRNLTARGLTELVDGRYQITAHWHRAVVRYLRRKHLLYS
ncbi:MAG: AAA family ATPase [Deltaproteobacteria bacterium]|nr:AAA family ATPase [Deltaproteobacteria bacterium]